MEEYERNGCKYRSGINCTDKTHCNVCGFNPKEEALRNQTIQRQLQFKSRSPDKPYSLKIFKRGDGNHDQSI